jgi:hypothetical protein
MTGWSAFSRDLRRTAIAAALAMGALAGSAPGVAGADCVDDHMQIGSCMAAVAHARTAPPVVGIEPAAMRAFCAVSECYLVTDLPGAGIGGKP